MHWRSRSSGAGGGSDNSDSGGSDGVVVVAEVEVLAVLVEQVLKVATGAVVAVQNLTHTCGKHGVELPRHPPLS